MFGYMSNSIGLGQRPQFSLITSDNLLSKFSSTQLWYDFSQAGSSSYSPVPTNVANAGSMTQAHDISGANHNTSAVSNFKYITNALGSLSAANMGTGGYFNTNSTTSWLGNLAGMTVIVICKPTTTMTTAYLCNTDQGDLQIFYSSGAWRVKCAGGTGVSSVSMSLNTWQLHSFVYNGNGSTNSQKLRYVYNKAEQPLTITGTIAAKSNNSNDNYVWGAQDTSSSNPFKGQIGEVLLFNKALSSGEVTAIETYLGNKWGV